MDNKYGINPFTGKREESSNSVNSFYQFNDYVDANGNTAFSSIETGNDNAVVRKTFVYMAVLMVLSFASAIFTTMSGLAQIMMSSYLYLVALLSELVVVLVAQRAMANKNESLSKVMLFVYSLVNGMTLGVIIGYYEPKSVAMIFGITAALFAVLALVGYFTKIDLKPLGVIGIMGLVGVVILFIVNAFVQSSSLAFAICAIGLTLFIGLTAYDVQKIRTMSRYCSEDEVNTFAMFGALMLYLDFVNLFIYLLRLFGRANRS